MYINEKLFKLLTDFADCYDANFIPVVPTNPNLTYIVFKNAEVRDGILPFIKEPFYKEHDDDLIFKKTPIETWESIATIKSMLTDKINRLTIIENEINKLKENTYTNDCSIYYKIYEKCCYCFDKNQQPIVPTSLNDISKIEYFIFKSALYKTLFNDFLKHLNRTLIETDINDMCFCWSDEYAEWQSINHKLLQPTTLETTKNFLQQYKRTHNELENI